MRLREVDGRGIPEIRFWRWVSNGSRRDYGVWGVEYPNEYEWDCCRDTNLAWFNTWNEAIEFALTRSWE